MMRQPLRLKRPQWLALLGAGMIHLALLALLPSAGIPPAAESIAAGALRLDLITEAHRLQPDNLSKPPQESLPRRNPAHHTAAADKPPEPGRRPTKSNPLPAAQALVTRDPVQPEITEPTAPSIAPSIAPQAISNQLANEPGTPDEPAPNQAALHEAYRHTLMTRLQQARRYPLLARQQGQTGEALVRFAISASGDLIESELLEATPWPLLNHAALATVARASPFPKPPQQLGSRSEWTLPIRFALH